jgi:hypothetical protein
MERKRKYAPHLAARRFSPEQDAEIAQWYTNGLTQRSIAEKLKVNRSAVRNSLLRSDVTMRPKNSPRPEYDWVRCTCGRRAAYRTGQCLNCYNKIRNAMPDMRERKFNWMLMARYKLTRDAYDAMLAAQNGVCAICQEPPREVKLGVDHDHSCCPGQDSCGQCIRGLLCVLCNRAVRLLKDSRANVLRLLEYL